VASLQAVAEFSPRFERLAGDRAVARQQQPGVLGVPARRRFVADDLHATPYVRDRHRAAVSASLEYRVAFVRKVPVGDADDG
jgi:hypothetical protein